ncbi:MAG: PHP domain-containing protein [Clostridia bacterium]|nr:PHP domain-containing protein [Clostridia bacterium]
MKICDLHCHSTFSDGTLSPSELVALAVRRGISALALTDHNTSGGLGEFVRAGKEHGLITVPGCEFSTEHEGHEVHVVGLFFDEKAWPEIEDFVEHMHEAKRYANKKMIAALAADGYDVTYEEAAALTETGDFNRAHVARVLLEKGQVKSVADAFATILAEGAGYYVPARKLSSIATISFIRLYGAVAVLAHPFLNFDEEGLTRFLPEAKKAGLNAIETSYTEFTREQTALAEELADRFGLLRSGGSDFHGSTKPDIMLGCGRGGMEVPFEYYEKLANAARNERHFNRKGRGRGSLRSQLGIRNEE